ncbi:MAG: flagellar basal body L-ring protein FlgH [Rhodocyclaceae bacterium]
MNRATRLALCLCVATHLAACSLFPAPPVIDKPTTARATDYSPRIVNRGAIYQASNAIMLFEEPVARYVGDVLTIELAESMKSSSKTTTTTSKEGSAAAKGPGALASMTGILKELFNIDADTSASAKFEGTGKTETTDSLSGTLAVTVVDVLPNGNLMVGGDKRMSLSGNMTTLRFTGVVRRRDIQQGNVISSKKVADARIEQVGRGVIADANTLGWMQRLFLTVLDI